MENDIEYYLDRNLDELKDIEVKREILYNENHYIFVWFCQRASKEQLSALLDEEGITLLGGTERLTDKLNGLLTSGQELDLFENEKFCELVLDNNGIKYTQDLDQKAALDFARYVYENERERILELYKSYSADNQIAVLSNMVFDAEEKKVMFKQSKQNTAQFLLNENNIDLSDLEINDIESLANKKVIIPPSKITTEFIKKISNIADVNRYRMLRNRLEEYNDVSQIETERKTTYERELATIGEDGLLEKFKLLKEKIESKEISEFEFFEGKNMGDLEGLVDTNTLYKLLKSKNLAEDIKKVNDYYLSNMVVDYFFQDVPTNVLKNMNSMLVYNDENTFLSSQDKRVYEMFRDIDTLDAKHKIMMFEGLKSQNVDMVSKFYDDFSKSKETMVEQINDSILTEQNVGELYNKELSDRA